MDSCPRQFKRRPQLKSKLPHYIQNNGLLEHPLVFYKLFLNATNRCRTKGDTVREWSCALRAKQRVFTQTDKTDHL